MTEPSGTRRPSRPARSARAGRRTGAPRDAGSWAPNVRRLSTGPDRAGTNVAGRRLTGPVQGFGQMWQKTYRLDLGPDIPPRQAIGTWKAHFGEFWPDGSRFDDSLTGISPGDVALLDVGLGGGVRLSTGVFVLYADEESFTLMTPQGHMFAGWITFSAASAPPGPATTVQAQILMRANDPLYELAMALGGHRKEDQFWIETVTSLGRYLGAPPAPVQAKSVCVDPRRQWRQAGQIWHNSMIRSLLPSLRTRGALSMAGNPDAVIVGSGPNGLAAAVTLTAAGLRVLVIEGAPTLGGGCRTEELTLPGFRHDVCSASHPLALASPFFRRFGLAARGVRFAEPEVVLAHPLDGGAAAVLTRSVAQTAAGLGADGAAYQRLMGPLARDWDALTQIVLSSMRRPPAHCPPGLLVFGRNTLRGAAAIARRMSTPGARALIAGLGAHAMLPLTRLPTGATALTLGALAHGVGWPVAEGGSARIVDAMAEAVRAGGGEIETGQWVSSLAELPPARAVLLDVAPRGLIGIAGDRLPDRYRRALERFRYGAGVCKVDYALSGPVPWTSEPCRRAGTLHVAGSYESLAAAEDAVAAGRLPSSPTVLVVQPSVADSSRAPAGQHTLWAYCHVPAGSQADMSAAITAQIERFAPGFRDLILASAVRTAAAEQAANPNYVGGDIAAGQQTVWQTIARPVPRWNPYRTPVPGLYLCSSSTPPLPGVHGRCGELAAATALRDVFGIRHPPDIGPPAPARTAAAVGSRP